MEQKSPTIAAIDVGTNSIHMVIASVNSRGMLQIIGRDKEMVRLGSSGGDMKYLQPDAMARALTTLDAFVKIAHSENAEIHAVATSAVREALNKEEFLDKVFEETGIEIEVISGVEEGRLIYIGAMHALPIYQKKALVLDIGGGSTETVIGIKGEIQFAESNKIGAVRLAKRFFENSKTTKEEIRNCREYINGEWMPHLKRINEIGFDCFVGTSGTIQTIACMTYAMKNEPVPDVINGINIKCSDILEVIKKIISADTLKKRQDLPGIDPQRADIIIPGALILEEAILKLNINKILVSSYSLREGIVFDIVKKKEAIQEFKHLSFLRYETVYHLMKNFGIDVKHAEHVKDTALKLFDDLQPLHQLGDAEREILEAACLLHDVGYFISHDQHHKHSYYLIMNSMMPGFTNDEAEIIANIARYHRKSHPKKKHENFIKLSLQKQNIVRVLAAILRIAEGIDRRMNQIVKSVSAKFDNNNINISILPADKDIIPDIELWGANRRKLFLEETLGRKIEFELEQ